MSKRAITKLAAAWAGILGASAGAADAEEFAQTGGSVDVEGYSVPGHPASREELLATLAAGQESWDTGAINADAAGSDRCPIGHEDVYYAAYETSARTTARRLAEALA